MVDTGKELNGEKLFYEVVSNGYIIYLHGKPWIKQLEPYGKIYLPNASYEENALAQIENICDASKMPSNNDVVNGDA